MTLKVKSLNIRTSTSFERNLAETVIQNIAMELFLLVTAFALHFFLDQPEAV